MGRVDHPQHGTVCERTFRGIVAADELRELLARFEEEERILAFRLAAEELTVWRPWVEGGPLGEFFRGATRIEALEFSRDLFGLVLGALAPLHGTGSGHGALEPDHILLGTRGAEVVDPVFNRPCLVPHEVDPGSVWRWGAGVPEGWELAAWDRLALLRTAALLAAGPAAWEGELELAEAAELCREWAAKVVAALPAESELGREIDSAVALLGEISGAVFAPLFGAPPSYPIEEELEALAARQGDCRMLRRADEEALGERAREAGLAAAEIAGRLEVWILRRGLRRERELVELARGFLAAGLDPETRLVGRRAGATAERCFTFYGVADDEAERRVGELLEELDGSDERAAAAACRRDLDERFGERPAFRPVPEPGADDLAALVAAVAAKRQRPAAMAERLVRLDLERRRLEG